jgi:multiple sugar transport system permease protein/sn-glycerol 3-phosphate transport system permease protein
MQTTAPAPRYGSNAARRKATAAATYIFLTLASILFLFPLYWQVSTSLKTMQDSMRYPPLWVPIPPQWSNYAELLDRFPMFQYLGNSAFVSLAVILGTLVSCSMAAYGFARLRMPGKDAIFIVLLTTLMLPGMVTLIPQFVMFQRLHWTNTFFPLIVPAFFGSAMYIFMLRQFFMTIPRDLEDAARIDGAGYLRSYAQIVLPLAKPALLTVGILTFVATWNDFFGPLIYLSDKNKYTVAVALRYLQGSVRTRPENHLLMAAATLSIIPPLIIFFVAQRQFMQGIVVSGVKG